MLISRQLNVFTKFCFRSFSKAPKIMSSNHKQVHEEIMRHVNPFARINIKSNIFVKIRPADVHNYPNGDAFIAELHGSQKVNNCTATMSVNVSEDEKEVNVELEKLDPKSTFHCELSLPIRAEIAIDAKEPVDIHGVQSNNVEISCEKDIGGGDIKAEHISLCSKNGQIRIRGLLLSKKTVLSTLTKGSISLDKLQGDELICKTKSGNISVKSSYVTASKFETDNGDLQLNNIHRNVQVQVNDQSNISMSGLHGNLTLDTNGGTLDIHFSQLEGRSCLNGKHLTAAKINISDDVEKSLDMNLKASEGIVLEESLISYSKFLSSDSKSFKNFKKQSKDNKIDGTLICAKPVLLGKLSWEDSLKAKLNLFNKI